VETRTYSAFGGQTSTGTAAGVLAGYTGHNDDPTIGLTNMRGRLYDQRLGRFITPDRFVTNPGSSQGWNRYAYVQNNPLAFTDPTGFYLICDGYEETKYCQWYPDPNYGQQAAANAQAAAEAARHGMQAGQSAAQRAQAEAQAVHAASEAAAEAARQGGQAANDARANYENAMRAQRESEANAQQGQPPAGFPGALRPDSPQSPGPVDIPLHRPPTLPSPGPLPTPDSISVFSIEDGFSVGALATTSKQSGYFTGTSSGDVFSYESSGVALGHFAGGTFDGSTCSKPQRSKNATALSFELHANSARSFSSLAASTTWSIMRTPTPSPLKRVIV
jgi:RHS repeat-associated protein